MPFKIIQEDITKVKTEAIVNAANTTLTMGGGVSGAIFKAAGAEELQAACSNLAPIKTGEAVITPGFDLPAQKIIHTAGPVYKEWNRAESAKALRAAYSNSLQVAQENGCGSIAFPLISSGIYGYPKEEALQVATAVIKDFLREHELDIFLVVLDRSAIVIEQRLRSEVSSYLREHYAGAHESQDWQTLGQEPRPVPAQLKDEREQVFSRLLRNLATAKGISDEKLYKRANISSALFSQIMSDDSYRPSKIISLAFAIALRLNLDESKDLLRQAGYELSHALKSDVIIEYFIRQGQHDIFKINEVLFVHEQPLLS